MKGFIIKNINIGLNENILKEHEKFFYDFLFPILNENYTDNDYLFILGNLFSNKESLNIKTISFIIDILDYMLEKKIKIFFVLGNNELKNIELLKIINRYKNIKIVDDFFNFKNITLLSHNKKLDTSLEHILSTNYDILNLHINKKDLNKSCGIDIIDFINNKKEFKQNNINKKYYNVSINNIEDLKKIEDSEDYIYVDINDSIIDLEFKNYLKLFSYKENFFINIIKNNKEILNDIEEDYSDNLSTIDIIKTYIEKKLEKVEDTKKQRFLHILDDAIKINKNS